jgi:hypothetical protein
MRRRAASPLPCPAVTDSQPFTTRTPVLRSRFRDSPAISPGTNGGLAKIAFPTVPGGNRRGIVTFSFDF